MPLRQQKYKKHILSSHKNTLTLTKKRYASKTARLEDCKVRKDSKDLKVSKDCRDEGRGMDF